MDYRVAEYSRLLPYEYQYGKYGLKTILKDILYEMVPPELLDRPKRGFVPPMEDWLRGEHKEEFMDTVSVQNVNNYLPELETTEFIRLRDKFLRNQFNNTRMFFSAFTYLKWHSHYFIR